MQQYASEFARVMDAEGIKYTVRDERVINISYSGTNLPSISIFAFFDKDGEPYVQFYSADILSFKGADLNKAYQVCNALNADYRWVKFYVDNDSDICATLDATLDLVSSGEECVELLGRIVSIIDEAYPQIAKARWA